MSPDQQRVLALLRKYGHETISFQVLEPGLHYWFDDEACVAYADTGRAWVTAGAPIAAPRQVLPVMERFAAAARAARRRPRFFGLEQDVSAISSFAVTCIGEQPVWNPRQWPRTLTGKRSLREQLRRARAAGVRARTVPAEELTDPNRPLRRSVDLLVSRWTKALAMAPMGFVVSLDLYNAADERRFVVAECDGCVVGLLVAVPIFRRGGWFFEDVLRDPQAPNGTVELMFDHAMRMLVQQGSTHVTFGLAPLSGAVPGWLRAIRDRSRRLYDFEGLRAFKAKLCPDEWHPVYLAYPAGERGVRALVDVLAAFAGGSLVRFGWRTLVHRSPRLRRLLGLESEELVEQPAVTHEDLG